MNDPYELLDLEQEELRKIAFIKRPPKQHPDNGKNVLVIKFGDFIERQGEIVRYDVEPEDDYEIVFIELLDGTVVTSLNHNWRLE